MEHSKQQKLIALSKALINQERARVIVAPQQPASGYWFGGGNMVEAPDGTFYLSGRYRNFGDSRTGLGAGERGLALAIFKSEDRGKTFSKVCSWSKAALTLPERPVLSIEGSALHFTERGVELFISSEKANVGYPAGLESFHKPNTGVWTIEYMGAPSLQGLPDAQVTPMLECRDPRFLHVKDPVIYDLSNGDTLLVFCTHPFNWASSNSAYAIRPKGAETFQSPVYDFFQRGFTWDVAISRITALLKVPQVGAFRSCAPHILAFYDGGESMRKYDAHAEAVKRPRGYSCEEIGGVAVIPEADLSDSERLSVNLPMFVSPKGTGASRYVDVLQTEEGLYATWEQSQADLSQPLVMNFVSWDDVNRILA